ncbi:hypothetical protein EV121DRAFT_274552, partial [Schizophyllum commune]
MAARSAIGKGCGSSAREVALRHADDLTSQGRPQHQRMTQLHAHFHYRNKQAFQRLLDADRAKPGGGAPSTSAGRGTTLAASALDVNKRDWLGRTPLHLACSAGLDALDYVRILLRHPAINVNLTDVESGWTALHRALYAGNLPAAILLLQRGDIDIS